MIQKKVQRRKGQALLEYVFLIAGIAFICLVAVSVFGHKLADQFAISAGMLPGAHDHDNAPIQTGSYAQYAEDAEGNLVGTGAVSWHSVTGTAAGSGDLANNVLTQGANNGDAFVAHEEDDE